MSLPFHLEKQVLRVANRIYAGWPRPRPDDAVINNCKIVSHRGEHDNKHLLENTLAAFDSALAHGVWGIECDVRWTRDLHPVVFHDSDCRRLFGSDQIINALSLPELQTRFPLIPTLRTFVQRYGGKAHLMIEIKMEHYPEPDHQRQILREHLADLEPEQDYHLLSLHSAMFEYVDFIPRTALIIVSTMNTRHLSETALAEGYGGIAGSYLFLNDQMLQKHRERGQRIGTGYIASKNCLFRELNRGVEWIFSNHAVKLQTICRRLLS